MELDDLEVKAGDKVKCICNDELVEAEVESVMQNKYARLVVKYTDNCADWLVVPLKFIMKA
jgi:hypothetical protein